jgi:isoleucyl-tRNA synthetase
MSKSKIPEVNPKVNFSKMEDEINEFWKKGKIFEKSVEQRPKDRRYSFVDGPPFVTGLPHYGSLLTSIPKDIIPRYWTMKGYRVRRVWGWDCHGLPIEENVNKKLGIKDKFEVETNFGVDRYVGECRKYVEQGISDWRWYIEKVGRWVDLDNAYRTMDTDFGESVVWAFKQMWEKGLVYKGKRVSLYSTDTSTPVSGFEVGMDDNYQDVEDLSIFVKFPLETDKFDRYTNGKVLNLIAWTTTPWTIPANFALMVNKDFIYSIVKYKDEYLAVAKDRLEFTFGDEEYESIAEVEGNEFDGLKYTPAYDFYKDQATKNDWHVYISDEVIEEEGTGVLHVAPGFGEVDFNLGKQLGLSDIVHIDEVGNMKDGDWRGVYIRDASPMVAEDLGNKGRLLRSEPYVHRLPFYRGDNPLIYMSLDSYFVDIQKIKPRMLELVKKIHMVPDIFMKRFIDVIETAPDWAISRNRYWATIMPIWESEDGEQLVIGSIQEMMKYTDRIKEKDSKYFIEGEEFSFHRDICDKIVLIKDEKEYHRIPEVLDCWMDSGSVPFAEYHYPFENEEDFKNSFPADFIIEYTGQLRAWFNVLFRLSTILFDDIAFKNVICHGVLFGNDGRKMSKSFHNYPDPKDVLENLGGEALRLYIMSAPILSGGDMAWSDEILNDQLKNILIPIWNTYRYLSMYANIHDWTPETIEFTSEDKLDRWLEVYMEKTAVEYSEALESYDIPKSAKLIQPCIDNISKWWIRRSRDRFASGDTNALQTLYSAMVLFSKIFAPQMPFLTEEIYQNLVVKAGVKDAKESVHLEDYPVFDKKDIDEELLENMETARQISSIGLKLREDAGIKLRQPLVKAFVGIKDEFIKNIIKAELNVQNIEYSEKVVEGDGFISAGEGRFVVTLDTNISEELKKEGQWNEFLRKYRDIRKKMGLKMEDIVNMEVDIEDKDIIENIKNKVEMNRDELQVKEVSFDKDIDQESGEFNIDEKKVKIRIEKI